MLALLTTLAILALVIAVVVARRVRQLLIDPAYGCLTRHGLTRAYRPSSDVLFLDIDDMHSLNARHGYGEVDRRIATALRATTRNGEVLIGRWYSGDELVVLCPGGTGPHIARRLDAALAAEGISATLAIATRTQTLAAAVATASATVQQQKAARHSAPFRAISVAQYPEQTTTTTKDEALP
jgi:GGDEF domain-containing protein